MPSKVFKLVLIGLFLGLAYCRNVIPMTLKTKRSVLKAALDNTPSTVPDPQKTSHHGTTVPLKQLIYGPIFLGSNGTTMEVMYDTGSPWLWVNDVNCPSCSDVFGMDPGFNCSASTTCHNTKQRTFWQYGIGSTDAILVKDRVSFGGNLTVENFTLGLATEVGDSQDMTSFNGICGLGLGNSYTVIDALKDQHKIEEKVFAMALNGGDNSANLFIGGIDMNHIDLTLPWYTFKLSSQREWKSDISSISMYGKNIKSKQFKNALFDSGTSHLIIDPETLNHFIDTAKSNHVECTGGDAFDLTCTVGQEILKKYKGQEFKTKEEFIKLFDEIFPTLTFSMSGQNFTIEPSYYASQCRGDTDAEISCDFLIAAFSIDLVILGDPLFRKYYVTFFEDKESVLLFHSPKHTQPAIRFTHERVQLYSSFLGRNGRN